MGLHHIQARGIAGSSAGFGAGSNHRLFDVRDPCHPAEFRVLPVRYIIHGATRDRIGLAAWISRARYRGGVSGTEADSAYGSASIKD